MATLEDIFLKILTNITLASNWIQILAQYVSKRHLFDLYQFCRPKMCLACKTQNDCLIIFSWHHLEIILIVASNLWITMNFLVLRTREKV